MALAPFLGAGSQIPLLGGRPSSPGPTTGYRLPILPGWFPKMRAESTLIEWIARASCSPVITGVAPKLHKAVDFSTTAPRQTLIGSAHPARRASGIGNWDQPRVEWRRAVARPPPSQNRT